MLGATLDQSRKQIDYLQAKLDNNKNEIYKLEGIIKEKDFYIKQLEELVKKLEELVSELEGLISELQKGGY